MRIETRYAIHLDESEEFTTTRYSETYRVNLIHMIPDADGEIHMLTLFGRRVSKNGRVNANGVPLIGKADKLAEVPARITTIIQLLAALPNSGTIPAQRQPE